jgi:hypothetical protein
MTYDPTAGFLRYTDGVDIHWNKTERPEVFVENSHAMTFTFACNDILKEKDLGNVSHGRKHYGFVRWSRTRQRYEQPNYRSTAGGFTGATSMRLVRPQIIHELQLCFIVHHPVTGNRFPKDELYTEMPLGLADNFDLSSHYRYRPRGIGLDVSQ